MGEYILAHDVGTTSDKAVLTDLSGEIISSAQEEYDVQYPKPTWAEQSPDALWKSVCNMTKEILRRAKVSPDDIRCISFSVQSPSTVIVGRDGKPIRPCIIWLDGRSELQVEWLERTIGVKNIYELTGQVVCSKSVISRIIWLRQNEPSAFDRAYKIIELKDYLEYKLTGNIVTDWSCASQSAFFDIRRRKWAESLCNSIGLSVDKLPELHSSIDVIGEITSWGAEEIGLRRGTPVVAGGADNACIAVGAGAARHKSSHICLSTSAWIGISSDEFALDPKKRMFTICHIDPRKWLYNAGIDTAGSCLDWFIHELGGEIVEEAKKLGVSPYKLLDNEASAVEPGSLGLLFIPYMFGERASVVDSSIHGGFIGLTLNHMRPHLFRSILEGIAYHFRWIIEELEDMRFEVKELKMVGGGASSQIWPQIFADVTGRTIVLSKWPLEAGALGAAYTAGVGLNVFNSVESMDDLLRERARAEPNSTLRNSYDKSYGEFKRLCTTLGVFYRT